MEAVSGLSRRERFRQWRYERPFWGCVLSLIFAGELYAATAAPMGLIVLQGVTVLGTIIVSLTLAILALATLAQPLLRTITGPLIVLLALVSLLVSNFGGFVVGMLIGLVGGGMIFAWSPTKNAGALAAAAPEPAADFDVVDEHADDFGGIDEHADEEWARADTEVIPVPEDRPYGSAGGPSASISDSTDVLPGGPARYPAEREEPGGRHSQRRAGGHRPTLLAVAWLLPLVAVALIAVGTNATPAVAQTTAGAPADFPCLIPFLCPSPSASPSVSPSTGASATPTPSASPLFPDPFPTSPSTTATPAPTATPSASASCDPADLPTSDGTPVGAVAALVAQVLQACAKPGTANAGTASEVSTVAIQPSVLKADRLTLDGLTYHGTVKLRTATGTTTVMDFSATRLTIVGMNLSVPFNARTIKLQGTSSTATISGNVRLYASDLSGKALDLLPLTFTANPPPILPQIALPSLFFTGATSHVALVSADSIKTSIAINVS